MIAVVDSGVCNVGSILNMLKRVGSAGVPVASPDELQDAKKVILPGIGAFDAGMKSLEARGLVEPLTRKATVENVPVLGICLGMQLMTKGSAEGSARGFGWIDAEALRFDAAQLPGLKVPHMGWNVVQPAKASALLADLPEEPRFYFVHSYFVRCHDRADSLLTARHGVEFDAAFERDNLFGVQFHPEKSHRFGMHILRNFAGLA
jgi:imidazole glycerol-phosphate synthase subunit HisH